MELSDSDKQRIEQEAKSYVIRSGEWPMLEFSAAKVYIAGATAATIYERQQQAKPPEDKKESMSAYDPESYHKQRGKIYLDGDNNSYSLMTSSDPEKREKGRQIRIHELMTRITTLEADRTELRNKVIELEETIKRIQDKAVELYGTQIEL